MDPKLQFIQKAFQRCQFKYLQKKRAALIDIQFHSRSLFSLYCLTIKTDKGTTIKLAAKEITSAAMAAAEQDGLEALKQVGVSVPTCYGYVTLDGKSVLFMEFIQGFSAQDSNRLSHELQKLYRNTYSHFGWASKNYIGCLEQPNAWHTRFYEFWWQDRIFPQIRLACTQSLLSSEDAKDLENIMRGCSSAWSLDDLKPRLIHGDLWSGNVLRDSKGNYYLIDPSLAYGNPEQDLAMLALFGTCLSWQQSEELAKSFGAGENFSERIDFWQIYPLLVHLNIFGASYLGQLRSRIRACLKIA